MDARPVHDLVYAGSATNRLCSSTLMYSRVQPCNRGRAPTLQDRNRYLILVSRWVLMNVSMRALTAEPSITVIGAAAPLRL
jgi:hypothetical protein